VPAAIDGVGVSRPLAGSLQVLSFADSAYKPGEQTLVQADATGNRIVFAAVRFDADADPVALDADLTRAT
jgi:hypothetical protein